MYRIVATVILLVLMISVVIPVSAQNKGPEVDTDAVLRMGNTVQVINGNFQGDGMSFGLVMGPPENDNDKWFISVIGQKNCAACLKLKLDWKSHPELLALAKPELNDQKKSWSHFNWYDKDDASQSFRFEKLKISAYPTVLVQPPRTGQYGDPKIVVYQGAYQGDPKKLADAIRDAIRKFLDKVPRPVRSESKPAIGLEPPFSPPLKADPNLDVSNAYPNPKAPDNVIPPPVQPEPTPVIPVKPLPLANLPWWALMGIGGLVVLALQYLGGKLKNSAEPVDISDSSDLEEEEDVTTYNPSMALVVALRRWQEDQTAKAEAKAKEAEEAEELRKVLLEVANKLAK